MIAMFECDTFSRSQHLLCTYQSVPKWKVIYVWACSNICSVCFLSNWWDGKGKKRKIDTKWGLSANLTRYRRSESFLRSSTLPARKITEKQQYYQWGFEAKSCVYLIPSIVWLFSFVLDKLSPLLFRCFVVLTFILFTLSLGVRGRLFLVFASQFHRTCSKRMRWTSSTVSRTISPEERDLQHANHKSCHFNMCFAGAFGRNSLEWVKMLSDRRNSSLAIPSTKYSQCIPMPSTGTYCQLSSLNAPLCNNLIIFSA